MIRPFVLRQIGVSAISGLTAVILARPAHAAGSNMPWEQPLQQILQSIEGPVAKIMAVIIIIITGLTLAFGDSSGGLSAAGADRVRPVDRFRRQLVLSLLLLLRRRSARCR